jgi:hypothetical protein
MEGLGRPWGMTDFKDFLLFHSRDCVRLALRFLLRRLHNLMTAFSIAFFASIFAVKQTQLGVLLRLTIVPLIIFTRSHSFPHS